MILALDALSDGDIREKRVAAATRMETNLGLQVWYAGKKLQADSRASSNVA